MGNPRDPETPAEWQEAADAAELFVAVDAATKYGLVTWVDAAGVSAPNNVDLTPAPLSILLKRISR